MSFNDAGRWLLAAVVGLMLAVPPTTALAAQTNGSDAGNRAVPAILETTNPSQTAKYQKVDGEDDDDGGGWGIGFGYPMGPWWNGWYSPPYLAWDSSYPAFQLEAQRGKVKIITARKNAKVYIDGGYVGKVKQMHTFKLHPGHYEIGIRAANGQNYSTNVYVLRGRTVRVRPNFKTKHGASS